VAQAVQRQLSKYEALHLVLPKKRKREREGEKESKAFIILSKINSTNT
jgi:hypothetical protein